MRALRRIALALTLAGAMASFTPVASAQIGTINTRFLRGPGAELASQTSAELGTNIGWGSLGTGSAWELVQSVIGGGSTVLSLQTDSSDGSAPSSVAQFTGSLVRGLFGN